MIRRVNLWFLMATVFGSLLTWWLVYGEGLTPLTTLMSALALAASAIMIRLWFIQPRRVYDKTTRLRRRCWMDMNEERIHFRTDGVDSQLMWNNDPRLLEIPRVIFLAADHFWMVLLKRVFPSPEEAEDLKNFYRRANPTGTVKLFK